MKKTALIGLFLVVGQTALASGTGTTLSNSEYSYAHRCEYNICRDRDGGKHYAETCDFETPTARTLNEWPAVLYPSPNGSCICPCDYGFRYRVLSGN